MEKVKIYVEKLVQRQIKALEAKLRKSGDSDQQNEAQELRETLSAHEQQLNSVQNSVQTL